MKFVLVPLMLGLSLTSCLQLPASHYASCAHEERHAGHAAVTPPAPQVEVQEPELPADPWRDTRGSDPVLYARDGSPVAVGQPETLSSVPPGIETRDVQQEDGSRVYLLELYQQAVDERDQLMLELSRQEMAIDELEAQRDTLRNEVDDLSARLRKIEGDNEKLTEESFELAERLTTAQIRRLEAEKVLLEATIEWEAREKARREKQEQQEEDR